ncbi:hypothetical protein EYR36_001782 [Pleurotus pulmonarius]|nr:hypothetical protein EYR36_008276 [Pleurotus pulmonarius]KAF4579962.1 hypothetical protein EYR36_001782 [Pleurotus pulmonarius]
MSNIYRTKRPGIAEDAPTIDNVAGRKGSGDQNRPGAKSELRQGVRNYPPESDSESYQGARANFAHNERTATSSGNLFSGGLIGQDVNGTDLISSLADVKQGVEEDTRREMEPMNVNLYGKSSSSARPGALLD